MNNVLDTHIWAWWTDGGMNLPPDYLAYLQAEAANGLGVPAICCWEVAKLVSLGRLALDRSVETWVADALAPPVRLVPLTPAVAVESTHLPGTFHRDPADQLIVATARVYDLPLVTLDGLIRKYPHVRLAP